MKRADARQMYNDRKPTHLLQGDPVVVTSTRRVRHCNRWVAQAHVIHKDGQTCNVMEQDLEKIKR